MLKKVLGALVTYKWGVLVALIMLGIGVFTILLFSKLRFVPLGT
ncbi:MAG TPA: hypothetical protein VN426_07510 [Syntrophomonadaceae bacterium]|nr:hypothetical protein [Syntrophomonadaceae bacterium]